MDTKETLLPVHTPESRPISKRVQFSRSNTDIDLSSRGWYIWLFMLHVIYTGRFG